MRKLKIAFAVAFMTALFTGQAFAANFVATVSAHVVGVNDPTNILGGQVVPGQNVTGKYFYETTSPDLDPSPTNGHYAPALAQGGLSFMVGPYLFETNPAPPNAAFFVDTTAIPPNSIGPFRVFSFINRTLTNGANVQQIVIDVPIQAGPAGLTDALPTTAPTLASLLPPNRMFIDGNSSTGSFHIDLQIDSMQSAPDVCPPAPSAVFQASPSGSTLFGAQIVEPAIFRTDGVPIQNLRGTVNGMPIPASYLSQCFVTPPSNRAYFVLKCRDLSPLLKTGSNTVTWTADSFLPPTYVLTTSTVSVIYNEIR